MREAGRSDAKALALPPLKVEYLLVTPANRIATIAEGKADLECGSTTSNAERRKQVAFTIPHYITGTRYMVRRDSGIAELRQFGGKKLVSTKGTTPLKAVAKANSDGLLRIELLEAPDHARAVEMVEQGAADGFAMNDVLLYGLIAGRPDPSQFIVVGKFLTIEPLAIMLSTPFHKYAHAMKSMRFGSGQGANHSDALWHRADLQRRPGPKGAISCGRTYEMGYLGIASK